MGSRYRDSADSLIAELVGAPFLEGGRDPETGIDCLGVTILVAALRGRPIRDPWADFQAQWAAGVRDLAEMWAGSVPPGWHSIDPRLPAREDDVSIFTVVPGEDVPGHIGYLVAEGILISACEQSGVYTKQYARVAHRVVALWRWKGTP